MNTRSWAANFAYIIMPSYLADLWAKQGRTDLQHNSAETIFYQDPCYLGAIQLR